jgi:hypothetical protein
LSAGRASTFRPHRPCKIPRRRPTHPEPRHARRIHDHRMQAQPRPRPASSAAASSTRAYHVPGCAGCPGTIGQMCFNSACGPFADFANFGPRFTPRPVVRSPPRCGSSARVQSARSRPRCARSAGRRTD